MIRQDDIDTTETAEWLEALQAVLEQDSPERAGFLIQALLESARSQGVSLPNTMQTAYVNTIPPGLEPEYPGDLEVEERIQNLLRWNAMAIVVRANQQHSGLGGHIASYASSATLFEVGFHHFFRGSAQERRGDLIFFQGHCSPGIYARAFLEGRLSESQLERFRQEVGPGGISSYPHPWLMPDFWEFPTVSMGLGPIMAIYQARFLKYLQNRGLVAEGNRKV